MDPILAAELANDPLDLALKGAAPEIALNILNRPGTAENPELVFPDSVVFATRGELSILLSDNSLANLQAFKESVEGRAFKFIWELPGEVEVSSAKVRGMITAFAQAGLITAAERDAVLALALVKKSRAEELIGRKLTLGDFDA